MKVPLLGLVALIFVVGCSSPPPTIEVAPTPNIEATVEAKVMDVLQSLPTATPYPTYTPIPTYTNVPAEPTPTNIPTPSPTPNPTEIPTPNPTSTPAPTPKPTFWPTPTMRPPPTMRPTIHMPELIREWSGQATKDTETFYVPTHEWRISWDTRAHELGDFNFQIFLYKSDGSPHSPFVLANVLGADKDSSVIRGKGNYYMTINTPQPYTVKVETVR